MTPEQESQNPISPEVLFSLGLTPETAARINPETQRQHVILNIIKRNGRSFYHDIFHSEKPVYLVELFNPAYLGRKKLIKISYDRWYSDDPLLKGILNTETICNSYSGLELSDVPDALDTESMKRYEEKGNMSVLRRSQKITSAFLAGFGDAALENADYLMAVNAFDVASINGILNDQTVMKKLKDIARADEVAGVRIAQAIQARIQKTELSASS